MLNKATFSVTLLALLFGSHGLSAQQSSQSHETTAGKGFFMVGWQQLDVDNLNDRVTANGFPSVSANMISLGGGGWATFENGFTIGGEGHGLVGAEETGSSASVRSKLSGGYGMLLLGYRAHSGERLDVTPLVGLGMGGVTLEGPSNFDDPPGGAATEMDLSAGGFVFDVSAVADVQVTGSASNDGGAKGLSLGVRTGFAYSPGDWDWERDDTAVPGGPAMGIRGFYVRLLIGGRGGD